MITKAEDGSTMIEVGEELCNKANALIARIGDQVDLFGREQPIDVMVVVMAGLMIAAHIGSEAEMELDSLFAMLTVSWVQAQANTHSMMGSA